MFDVIIEFLVSRFGPQLLVYLFVGYLTLIICFYDGNKWKAFSDFDKIGFSFLTGFTTWLLVIQPLYLYLQFIWNVFISFSNESYISAHPLSQNWFSLIVLPIGIVLFFFLLRTLNGNKPFSGFDEVIERISKILIGFWTISIFSQLFIYGALQMTIYSVYSDYLLGMSIFNFLFLGLFIAFLVLIGKLDVNFEKVKSLIHINYNRRLLFCLVVVLVLIIVGIPVSGLLLLNPSVQDHGETIHSITNDSPLTIGYMVGYGTTSIPEELMCKEYITREYTITTPRMLSWVPVPIDPPFIVIGATRWINKSTSKNYAPHETYFIVNESRYQEVNVSVNGYRNISLILNKDYHFEVESRELGKMTEIDFTVINKMPYTLNLREIKLYTPESFGLVDWGPKTDGIYDVVEKTPNIKLIFASLEGNQSSKVTLFLEEIEMNTTGNVNN